MTDAGTGGEPVEGHADGGPAAEATAQDSAREDADDPYGGLPGAFAYALRASGSLLFRSYVVVAALLTLGVALVVGLGVVTLVAGVGGGSGVLNLSRALYVLVGLAVLAPVVAPVLLVARRHRRGAGAVRYDRGMGLAGYLVVASLYVGLVTTVPQAHQEPAAGALAPAVEFLYALPPAAGVAPPLVATAVVALVHRRGDRVAERA